MRDSKGKNYLIFYIMKLVYVLYVDGFIIDYGLGRWGDKWWVDIREKDFVVFMGCLVLGWREFWKLVESLGLKGEFGNYCFIDFS